MGGGKLWHQAAKNKPELGRMETSRKWKLEAGGVEREGSERWWESDLQPLQRWMQAYFVLHLCRSHVNMADTNSRNNITDFF